MIGIAGSIHRKFQFPAIRPAAFAYYADIERTLSFLMHISLVEQNNTAQYRLLYHTTELGIYRVRLFCDIQVELDQQAWTLRIRPSRERPPVKAEAGVYSLSGQGFFSSESIFKETGDQTQIDYRLDLHASLPVPYAIRFMPATVLNSVARNITQWRIHEIAEGFIDRSIQSFHPTTSF